MAILPIISLRELEAQLLGAGTGVGSCRAFPYRAEEVDWEVCPQEVPCCNEYGYCRSREEWNELQFRDCNGVSNGIDLPKQVLQLENALGGVAGESLGAEKTFDISQVGGGAFGPGSGVTKNSNGEFNLASGNGGSGSGFGSNFGSNGGGGGFSGSGVFGGSNGASGGSFGNGGSNSFSNGNGGGFSSNNNQNGGGSSFSSNNNQNAGGAFSSNRNQNGGGRIPNQNGGARILNNNVGNNRRQSSLTSSGAGNGNSIEDAIFSNSGNSGSNRFNSNGGGFSSINRNNVNGGSRKSSSSSNNSNQRKQGSISNSSGGKLRNRGNNRNSNRNSNRNNAGSRGNSGSRRGSNSNSRNYGSSQNLNSNQVDLGGSGGYGGEVSGQVGGLSGSQLNSQSGAGASSDFNKFPFSDYVNTAGYPMNLNSENCPKYPFCWWNPYSRLNNLVGNI